MAITNYQALVIGNGTGTAELGLKVSEQILPKLFANVAYLKGFMVDGKYDFDGRDAASIVIPTLRRPTGRFKDMKAENFNPYAPTTDRVGQDHIQLDIDKEYNELIDIPEAMLVQNIIGGSVVSTMSEYVGKTVAENINYVTADAITLASNEYNSGLIYSKRKLAYVDPTSTTISIPDYIAELKAKIGNADPLKGDTSFNGVPLSMVVSNTMEAYLLKTKNQFILESSYGQELLIEGTFGRITLNDNIAYRGKILGVQMFVLPDAFFPNLNSASTDFTNKPTAGAVLGVMGIAEANYRVFNDYGIKITDATAYRGWILQPLYRVGVKVAKPWGDALLVTTDYVDANLQAVPTTSTFIAGDSTGKTELATLTAVEAAAGVVAGYLYKAGDQKVTYKGAYANGTDGWATATIGTTQITAADGDLITVIGVSANGTAVSKSVHKVLASEIA